MTKKQQQERKDRLLASIAAYLAKPYPATMDDDETENDAIEAKAIMAELESLTE